MGVVLTRAELNTIWSTKTAQLDYVYVCEDGGLYKGQRDGSLLRVPNTNLDDWNKQRQQNEGLPYRNKTIIQGTSSEDGSMVDIKVNPDGIAITALPEGASTEIAQDTANAHLDSIDTKLPSNLTVTDNKLQVELPKGSLGDVTAFNEQQVALRSSQMNFKPTWGVTTYRYKQTTTGAGTSAVEENGEFRLRTGTAATNVSSITTNQRGQYQAGTIGQSGIGFRIPSEPTGTQYAKWGYSDFTNNGFYFGRDVTGLYVAYLTGGIETKIYQSNWNVDKLDGTGESGLTITPSNGGISQIDFIWYGYGDIKFSFVIFNAITLKTEKIVAHTLKINSSVSIIDPNQPLKFEVGNGASSTTDFNLYIGGHQFSVIDGFSVPQKRLVSELLSNYTTALNTNWQPIIAFRKKSTFNGRPNSVNGSLENFEVYADGELETRITTGGTTSNLAWGTPTGVASTETAIETKVTGGTVLTTSVDGSPSDYGFVTATNRNSGGFSNDVTISLGDDIEVILWVRRLTAVGAIVIKHANLTWKEEW